MKVLHVSKTSEGAFWAVRQVADLVRSGIEVHVALPARSGAAMPAWEKTDAKLHFVNCSLPTRQPGLLLGRIRMVRDLVREIKPDLIHSHFVTTTLMMRLALGRRHRIPRIFQVPGPLHLEHWHTRTLEIGSAGDNDFWIGSSRYIVRAYAAAGVIRRRRFLSYHSTDANSLNFRRSGYVQKRFNIPADGFVVGNINLIYPPKTYLGQKVGLKCHEDVIEAISLVQQKRPNVWGVLIGGTFGNNHRYEYKLRELAGQKGCGKIIMPGKFTPEEVAQSWPDFDCAVHVPMSENCGGVVEPLLCGVPTIAGEVGGLSEVVQAGLTGGLVPIHRPEVLARTIISVMDNNAMYKQLAARGRQLVSAMFDPQRCGQEILKIYRHILFGEPCPEEFDPKAFLASIPELTAQCSA